MDMKLLNVCASLMLLGMAGCLAQQKVWKRVDGVLAPEAQFRADKAMCAVAADQAGRASAPVINNTVIVQQRRDDTGFITENPARFDAGAVRSAQSEAIAFEGCMAQRGYVLVDAPPR